MSKQTRLRLFLDSNVLTGGILAQWGLDKAVLSLCAARICRMVLAEYVREEVEENLLTRAAQFSAAAADQVIEDYGKLLKLARPEVIPLPLAQEVASSRHLIKHAADVPVLLSAIHAQPDWLLTHNTNHFTPAVAKRTGLRIATPAAFFRALAEEIS
jgi:predicted nucleic acid-binding protein